MKFTEALILLALATGMTSVAEAAGKKTPVDYVNPLVGTAVRNEGGLVPFVGRPFAMTNFVPQTRENRMGRTAYVHDDSLMIGFMASHQPTIWMGDYGYMSVMPQAGELRVLPETRGLLMDKKTEVAKPYYYSVSLGEKKKIKAEMTATSRAGILRFAFPEKDARIIVQGINLNPGLKNWCNDYSRRMETMRGYVEIDPEKGEIRGYNPDRQSAQLGPELKNFNGYFVIRFSRPFRTYGTWDNDRIDAGSSHVEGTRSGAWVDFDLSGDRTVEVRIGTSFISIDQAARNLDTEIGISSFKDVCSMTRSSWNEKLSAITPGENVSGTDKTIFYTALYHCNLFPREFSEDGRYYSAFDDSIHEGDSYNDYSLWDTFRAYHPLMTLIEPELTGKWISSLLQMYREGGWMPMWPNPTYTNIMIGTHADAVIADAYMKGIRNYDVDLAYEAMRKNAFEPPVCDTQRRYGDRDLWTDFEARAGASFYHSLGYIPHDRTRESVSRTLEYAFDDWCVAQVAKSLGKDEDYGRLMSWTGNYRNLYNRETGFMAPRLFNGEFFDNPDAGMTEGSKWTYLFCVLQDVDGLIDLMGGNDRFAAKLDENFEGGHYRHDNEPGHHYIYLYDYCGRPWKTQELVRKTVREKYLDAPDGLCGNDDCGQMSAWYIFSVMGFYPVTPGSNLFAIGAPQFPELTINLVSADGSSKHPLSIVAENLSEANMYVREVRIDGVRHEGSFLSYEDLCNAHELRFIMTENQQ